MKYDKPEVAVVELALRAVRSGQKGTNYAQDSDYVTHAAYEADE